MAYRNLYFFDSNGDSLNLTYDSNLEHWVGNVYLPEVATDLYETISIHILEEVIGELGQRNFIRPISETSGFNSFVAQFESEYAYSNDIFLYSASEDDGELYVEKVEKQVVDLLSPLGYAGTTSEGYKLTVAKEDNTPLTFRACLNSKQDSHHLRKLNIYEWDDQQRGSKVATIQIYGETVEEDERLRVLLSNIGMELEPTDYLIFKDSNILEGQPDWRLLNIKRKELLLHASQIRPFIGTYKALLNAIKFFGYNNITLNEYWLNINEQSEYFGKLISIPVPNQENQGYLSGKNKKVKKPNSNQKKTSLFSLNYRLNTANGLFDEWDIPKVDEVFDFSPDEVLIKLYGLKQKLQKDYLPLNARIVDIIGNADYYGQLNFNVWNDQYNIHNQESGLDSQFSVLPLERDLYIEDLRKVDYRLTGKSQVFQDLIDAGEQDSVVTAIENFYSDYYNFDKSTFYDWSGVPIGCPVVLQIENFTDIWDNAKFTWDDSLYLGEEGNFLTWDNWYKKNANDIFWRIRHEDGIWDQTLTGTFDEIRKIPLVLPYIGKYSVELSIVDLFNVQSSKIITDAIEVKNKNLEIYGLTQAIPDKKSNWNIYDYDWSNAGSNWNWGNENTLPVDEAVASFYLTLDRANYPHGIEDGVDHSTVNHYFDPDSDDYVETTGPYFWNNLATHTWQDGRKTAWYMTRIVMDVNASFLLYVIDEAEAPFTLRAEQLDLNDNLIVDEYEIQNYPTGEGDQSTWLALQNELINLDSNAHPILSNFNYNLVENEAETGYRYIVAVGRAATKMYDIENVELGTETSTSYVTLLDRVEYNNPNWLDSQMIYSHDTIHLMQHVTLSWDKTKMPGIKKQTWKLVNNTIPSEDIYYYNTWFTYLFSLKGDWSVELEVEDLNGNKNKIDKKILTIK